MAISKRGQIIDLISHELKTPTVPIMGYCEMLMNPKFGKLTNDQYDVIKEIMKKTDVECRVTSLGHVQRGAPPTASDRILASAFGVYAVDLLNQKKFDRMVAWKDRKVVDVPIDEGISTYKNVERKDSLVETALSLDIYIGDDI